MYKLFMLALVFIAAGCATQKTAPGQNAPPPAEKNEPAPADTPAPADDKDAPPAFSNLKGESVPWSRALVSGKRNLLVFMTAW